jgi:hypothetical protein
MSNRAERRARIKARQRERQSPKSHDVASAIPEPPLRDAGITPSDLLAQLAIINVSPGLASQVPCDGCRACCYLGYVELSPDDDRAHLDWEQRDGRDVLKRRPGGACIHLGEKGCTVYEHRPAACRVYDCRVLGLAKFAPTLAPGHRAPHWKFPLRTREDAAIEMAAYDVFPVEARRSPMAMYQLLERRLNACGGNMIRQVLDGIAENLPAARKKVAKVLGERPNPLSD